MLRRGGKRNTYSTPSVFAPKEPSKRQMDYKGFYNSQVSDDTKYDFYKLAGVVKQEGYMAQNERL